ncbi:MAG: Tab2 family RNA-binding protein, partial [Synechococcaceae cyanobacterium]|nr:Tab2 family RNA-binding protein [Synechococcaceae cyanobacterium]
VGPLAPQAQPLRPVPVPLPEVDRGEAWSWATLPAAALAEAGQWGIGFSGLVPLPAALDPQTGIPGIRLFGGARALAIAGLLAGLEPVRLEIAERQLVLEAGLEDRWLLAGLPAEEAAAAASALARSREAAAGLQFLAVQADADQPELQGFWLLRDLPDG